MRARILLLTLASGALAVGAVAASAQSASPSPTLVEAVEYAYVMPNVVKGGVVAMRFRNAGKEPHEFAFGRIDNGHTFAQAMRVFEQHK